MFECEDEYEKWREAQLNAWANWKTVYRLSMDEFLFLFPEYKDKIKED